MDGENVNVNGVHLTGDFSKDLSDSNDVIQLIHCVLAKKLCDHLQMGGKDIKDLIELGFVQEKRCLNDGKLFFFFGS